VFPPLWLLFVFCMLTSYKMRQWIIIKQLKLLWNYSRDWTNIFFLSETCRFITFGNTQFIFLLFNDLRLMA
jgi:hypothetical protein